MKISELIMKLDDILKQNGDLEVVVDSTNETMFGEIEDVVGKDYTYRNSNIHSCCYILSKCDVQKVD